MADKQSQSTRRPAAPSPRTSLGGREARSSLDMRRVRSGPPPGARAR